MTTSQLTVVTCLVLHEERIRIIRWIGVKDLEGQELFLDSEDRVKCAVPWHNAKEFFPRESIVLVDCDIRMKKKRELLPAMPLRLYRMYETTALREL